MSDDFAEQNPPALRRIRLDTLVRLRWLAVLGQTAAVLVVYDGFDFEVPFWACLAVIAVYAVLNVALRLRFRWNQRLEPHQAARLLALDIVELAVLLFLTGGLQNPFSFLLAGPVFDFRRRAAEADDVDAVRARLRLRHGAGAILLSAAVAR